MTREAIKFDDGKLPWTLVPWDAMMQVVAVLAHGADTYSARNWETGMTYSRLYAAADRHLRAAFCGQDHDIGPKGSGLLHLAHAAACVLFLLAYQVRGIGDLKDRNGKPFDDRPHRWAATERVPAPRMELVWVDPIGTGLPASDGGAPQ